MSFATLCSFVKKHSASVTAGLARTKPAERALVQRLVDRFTRQEDTTFAASEEAAALALWNESNDLMPWYLERGLATALDILIRATTFKRVDHEWDNSVWVLRRARIEEGLAHLDLKHWVALRDAVAKRSPQEVASAKALALSAAKRSWLLRAALAFVFPNEGALWSKKDEEQLRQADPDSYAAVAYGTLAALRKQKLPPTKPSSWVALHSLEHLKPAFVHKALGSGAVPVFRLQRGYGELARIGTVDAIRVFGEFADGGIEYLGNEPNSESTWPFIKALKPSAKVFEAFASLFTTHVPRRTVALPLARAQLGEWLFADPKQAHAFARAKSPEATYVSALLNELGLDLPRDETWVSPWAAAKAPKASKTIKSSNATARNQEAVSLPKVVERIHWANAAERQTLAAAEGEDRGPAQDKQVRARLSKSESSPLMLYVSWASDKIALELFDSLPPSKWYAQEDDLLSLLARFELDALPSLLKFLAVKPNNLQVLARVESAQVAPTMARALIKVRKHRELAQKWLEEYPLAAVVGLWPLQQSSVKAERDAAQAAFEHLRSKGLASQWLAPSDARESTSSGVTDLTAWPKLPPKAPRLPAFIDVTRLPRPIRKDGLAALDVPALTELLTALKATLPDRRDFADAVTTRFTSESLAALASALFRQWLYADAPPTEKWALYASGVFGAEADAPAFGQLATQWAPQGKSARAQETVEMLAMQRTVTALSEIQRIATKVQSKALRARAEKVFTTEAAKLGVSADDLADRIVPELGLPSDGSLVLSGFTVAFDSQLKPRLLDAKGVAHDTLPAGADEGDVETWAELKSVAPRVGKQHLKRLEHALGEGRRMRFEHFTEVYVMHPLLRSLARGLVWAAWRNNERVATFAVTERGLVDATGRAVAPRADAEYGLVHPVDLTPAERTAWKKALPAEQQPFEQLTRAIFTGPTTKFADYQRSVPTGALLALQSRGWRRGDAAQRGRFVELSRQGQTWSLRLSFAPGIDLSAPTSTARQEITDVRFVSTAPISLATRSELELDLSRLTAR